MVLQHPVQHKGERIESMQGAWSHACVQLLLITGGRELGYASWAIVFSSTAVRFLCFGLVNFIA